MAKGKQLNILLFISLVAFHSNSLAQSQINAGVLPKFVHSNRIAKNTKLVSSIESRQLLVEDKVANYGYVLTDLTNILSFKLSLKNSINTGYTLRIRDDKLAHRFIQQFNHIQTLGKERIGHRVGIDQTIGGGNDFTMRARYRWSIEKALNGTQIDPKEWYFKGNNEYIGAFTKNESELEIRLGSFLGYELNDNSRLETGIDYRMSDITDKGVSSNFWLGIIFYTNLK